MAWFPLWQLLHFLAFLIYISLAVYILNRTRFSIKNPGNITASVLFISFSAWSFGTIFMHNPGTPRFLAIIIDRVITVIWMLFPSLALLFFALQSGHKKLLSSRLFLSALALIPALCVFLFFSGQMLYAPVKTYFGWYSEWISSSLWPLVYFIYAPVFTAAGAMLFFFTAQKSKSKSLKKQAAIVVPATLLVLIISVYFDIIGPTYFYSGKMSPLNSIADLYIMIWAVAIFYSIVKYKMFSITPATAADNIISSMSEALFLLDDELKIIYANNAAHTMLNHNDTELFSKHFPSLLKDKKAINKILKTALVKDSVSGHEAVLLRKEGGPVPIMLSFNTLTESDEIKGFSAIATDITDMKIAEFQIKSERNRAQKYFDTADIMFVMVDMWRRVTMVNKRACEILEYSPAEMLGRNWTGCFIPEREEREMNIVFEQIVYKNSISGDIEGHIKTKSGKERLIRWSNTLMKNESGEATGVLSAGYDITEQALVQEQIKKLSVAVEQSPSSIVITDTNGRITYVNPKFTEITGYTKEETLGQNPKILKSGEWSREKYADLWKTISAGKQWRGEFHNKKKNNELFWESASISPIKDYKNVIISYIAIKEDITAQKKAEEDLRQSYDKLKELDMMKTSFTSMVSHELRTPLTSIKGFLSFLLSGVAGKITPMQKEFLETIRSNSERLLSLINDILDVSKMEAGSFTIVKKPCNILEITAASIKDIHSIAAKKNIKISVDIPSESKIINADGYRLSQVMINLINNSIKFSPQDSEIKIGFHIADAGNIVFPPHFEKPQISGSCAYITVADNGIGIKKENLGKIFTRFYQVENINTRHAQGTGLGLSIARNIVEAHGGCMWVDSEGEGKGAVFSFLLPAA